MSVKIPVLHSLILAAGAAAKNFKIEVFTEEPIVTEPGRLYFVNGALKFSYLDGQGALQIAVVATGSGLAEALATLTTNLQTEVDNRIAGDAALQSDIDQLTTDLTAEITRATDAEGVLTAAVAAETAARTSDMADMAAGLAALETSTAAADTALQASITNLTNTKADIAYVDGLLTSLGNAFQYVGLATGGVDSGSAFDLTTLGEIAAGAYYKVAGLSGTEAWFKVGAAGVPFMANGQDGLLFNTSGGVDVIDATDYEVIGSDDILVTGSMSVGYTISFTPAALARFTALQTAIDAEATTARAAEAALDADITALDTRVTQVETDAAAALAAEVTARTDADAVLQASIAALQTSSSGAVDGLKTALNGKSLIYTAPADVKDHTFTHNLGHNDYVPTVYELDTDGVTLLNSFVPFEANETEVIAHLAVNGKVKIFVQDMSDLA